MITEISSPSASAPSRHPTPELYPGLAGVAMSTTRLSRVDGEGGRLTLAGHALEDIASRATFEEMLYLLWTGGLPGQEQLGTLHDELVRRRNLSPATLELLRHAARRSMSPMDALRMAAGSFDLADEPALDSTQLAGFDATTLGLVAKMPTAVAAYHRLRRGEEPLEPRPELSSSADFLHGLDGREPSAARERALDTYLATVSDHGLNASTFTARVIVSTGSDVLSAVVGALGALKGPLHGGAPGPALDMVFEIGRPERAEAFLRAKLERGERLMGFGHRVYRVRDPRAEVLREAARELFAEDADAGLYALTRHVERTAVALLAEYKPGRRLDTNVELYTALLLHGLGLPNDLFTPVFAIGRTAGWVAHCREQKAEGRLIRPRLVYDGPEDLPWVPVGER